ncbi:MULTISPECIES: ATP-binding cassette domain-containing protein [unclassified Streptomyces]|uniref:ATP-binding cassette domain-containing protein n=1 Tax=unclassified Streptomyces TaxID=2593676 RepID=UPI001F04417D|nr:MULTISPECIES: ATP-binding cassette domain-containing protein [unclassified Streptomyces]MCH0564667.1 ATP-binding cassette domain-containing protein [Streptomyces sp. MUM 2J]MCH0570367.1 ATP-binding cassette domain-containing protein [Streptomyces sp. MUM 136J]
MQPPAGDDAPAQASVLTAALTNPNATHSATDPAYAISTRGLVKTYTGPDGTATHAVRGLDLDVFQGEAFAFLGPNGAGKSTTIALLCALARPTAGQATVAGADVLSRPEQVRRRVGMLFQHSALDPDLTAEQNLHIHARLYGMRRRLARLRTTETLDMVGLADRRRSPVRTLSGGMRRRLELARGLLHAPQVLFLDEPTTGLDPHARAQVWDHLRALRDRHGSTLFVTTHYLEEAEHCDRLAIIDDGRRVAQGTPHALKAAIGDDRVALRTGDDAAARQVVRRIAPPGAVVTVDEDGVCLRVPDGSAWIPRLCAALEAHGIAVHAATATPPTLDDVFFHHTGRSIHTARPDRTPAAPVAGGATAETETGP